LSVAVAPGGVQPRTAPAKLTADHLTPGPGLRREADGWHADGSSVTFTADTPLPPGWYRFRLRVRSHTRFGVYKRAEVVFDPADPPHRPVAADSLNWNRTLDSNFMIELPRATRRLTITLFHAEGGFTVERFAVARIPAPLVGLVAVAEKFKLLAAYRCLRPVLVRGGGMLLRGRFGEFGQKVLKGLRDSRVMRPGAYKASEVDGGWWRRHSLPERDAEAVRAAVNAMPSPEPMAVLLPVDPKRFDEARVAAHSVRRQLYPHWELLLACAGPHWMHPHLAGIVGNDPRVKVSLVGEDDGLGAAIAQSLADAGSERLVVLPPSVELAEDALYQLAEQARTDPTGIGFAGSVYDALAAVVRGESSRTGDVWLTHTDRLTDQPPDELTPSALGEWVEGGLPADARRRIDRVLAYPVQESPLSDRARVGPPRPAPSDELILAADLNGITGWNHVAYALLRGLPSVGVKLIRHPLASMDANLVPPDVIPPLPDRRRKATPVLAISPPFIAHRFNPDERTAVYTMWETDTLTPSDAAKLNAAGLVIVPSRWQVDCFRRSGVTVPIEVAPLGFDPLVFHDDGSVPEVCTFGTAGALVAGGMRKNAQRMIDLFRRAFPTERDVRLRVKISPTSPPVDTHDDPRVDLIRTTLPYPQLAAWYRSLTAYLNGSFGEGFGLHLIETMACGRPVISADYSGLTAFFDPTVGYAVPHTLVPVSNDVYTGHWADPDDAGIVARMREVYSDPAAARRLGRRAAVRAATFTWRKSGRKIVAALRKHGLLPATGGQA
jgi:glycosyltransferase involved in cell wall biosynthesis